MWINKDCNLPETLINAQRDGKLVVFAGAGVSMGNPSNLPSFEALAAEISWGSFSREEGEQLDVYIGRMEEHIDVQGSYYGP